MTIEKRGTDKLRELEGGLCPLTEDELSLVSGGCPTKIDWSTIDLLKPARFPKFPVGMFPPDLLNGTIRNLVQKGV